MLLGCSVFSSLLLTSPHVYLSLSSVLMATYGEKTQRVSNMRGGRVDLKTQLLIEAWKL